MATVAQQISYTDLYARWERGNWRATEIDFTEDRRQWWEVMTEFERKAALWNYALFFWGEDAVADGLSPYIDAAPTEEQKYFLATQQVDEARHAVFFARFMHEVCDIGDGTVAGGLEAIKPELTWGFRMVFDRLEQMSDELRRDPSLPRLVRRDRALPRRDRGDARAARPALHHQLPARARPAARLPRGHGPHRAGRAAPHRLRREAAVRHRGARPRVPVRGRRAAARGAAVDTPRVLVPPGWDLRYTEVFGFKLEDIAMEGADSLETKMRSAGLPMDELPGPPIFAYGLPAERRVENGLRLVKGGVLGEKTGPPSSDPETMAALFDLLRREPRPHQGAARARHDPVGLRRRRAVAPRRRQRRHARRAGPRRATRRSRSSAASRTGRTCSPGARIRCASPRAGACGRAATSAGCGARAACSRASGTEPAQNRSLDVRLSFARRHAGNSGERGCSATKGGSR